MELGEQEREGEQGLEGHEEQGLEEHEEQEPEELGGGQELEELEEPVPEFVPQPSHSPGETFVLEGRAWIPAHAAALELL